MASFVEEYPPHADHQQRRVFPRDDPRSPIRFAEGLLNVNSHSDCERKRRVKTSDRVIVVESTFEIISEALISGESFSDDHLISQSLRSTASPLAIDGQADEVCRIHRDLGTATVIVGSVERVRKFEDLIRLEAERGAARKRLISEVSMVRLIEEFSDTNFASTTSLHEQTEDNASGLGLPGRSSTSEAHPASHHKIGRIQDNLWDFGASVDKKFTTLERVLKSKKSWIFDKVSCTVLEQEKELKFDSSYHNNPTQLRQQSAISMAPSLVTTAAGSLYRTLTRCHKKLSRPKILPPEYRVSQGREKGINIQEWVSSSATNSNGAYGGDEESEYFMACTPTQLRELDPEIRERVRVAKAYLGPPTSPCPEEEDQFSESYTSQPSLRDDKHNLNKIPFDLGHSRPVNGWTVEQIQNYNDFAALSLSSIHEGLTRRLGLRDDGIQVVGTNLAVNFEAVDNLSEWYFMPLVESAQQTRGYHHPHSSTSRAPHFGLIPRDYDDCINEESPIERKARRWNGKKNTNTNNKENMNVQTKKPTFFPKHTQPPSHSLTLYLLSHGNSLYSISILLASLSENFVYDCSSRWWDGFRIPDHWEFDAEMVEIVKLKCKAEERWWEEDVLSGGRALRVVKERMRVRRAGYLVKKVVENYLWWRLKGERVHGDVLSV